MSQPDSSENQLDDNEILSLMALDDQHMSGMDIEVFDTGMYGTWLQVLASLRPRPHREPAGHSSHTQHPSTGRKQASSTCRSNITNRGTSRSERS
jgi:hypothetical protein